MWHTKLNKKVEVLSPHFHLLMAPNKPKLRLFATVAFGQRIQFTQG